MDRKYDIIVYGAGGYTAQYIIPHLELLDCNIALSGRNKLKFFKSDLDAIECLLDNIDNLTKQTRIIVNCVGPYNRTADTIIESCVRNATHYIDFCGETGFLSKVIEKYDTLSRQKNIFILQACGFDSIPADVGVEYLKQEFDCDIEIESVLEFKNCIINTGTWESLIDSVANYKSQNAVSHKKKQKLYKYIADANTYAVKFGGSDGFVVKRTQALCKKCNMQTATYYPYIKVGSMYNLIIYYLYISIIYLFCKLNLGRKLLVRYCSILSCGIVKNNPLPDEVRKGSFALFFTGIGLKNGTMIEKHLRIDGPDPGYTTTGATVALCAETLLEMIRRRDDHKFVQNVPGGVVTPGFLFRESSFVDKLQSLCIKFRVN